MITKTKDFATCEVFSNNGFTIASVETRDFGTFNYQVLPGHFNILWENETTIGSIKTLRNILDNQQIIYSYKHLYSVEMSDVVQEICLEHTLKIVKIGEELRNRI